MRSFCEEYSPWSRQLVGHVASLLSDNVLARPVGALGRRTAGFAGGIFWIVGLVVLVIAACELAGLRYIANNRVGVVEKLWSVKGSVPEGRIIALDGEAGFQAEVLRGGIAFRAVAVAVPDPQDAAGRDAARQDRLCLRPRRRGAAAEPDAGPDRFPATTSRTHAAFWGASRPSPDHEPVLGQRGRQRAILREGVYAINVALFTVMTEDTVYRLEAGGAKELKALVNWQNELSEVEGFNPVIIGGPGRGCRTRSIPTRRSLVDSMGIVTVHDGPSLPPGEIIAPAVGIDRNDKDFHNNFQDPEAFLRAGGRRGLQYVPLTDGTYFINRWFAIDRNDPQDDRADRLRRRGGQLLRPKRPGPLGPGVPPRRARFRRRARRPGETARARASMPSTPMPATSSWCRRPTSCCTG